MVTRSDGVASLPVEGVPTAARLTPMKPPTLPDGRRPLWEPAIPQGASALRHAFAYAEAGHDVAPLRDHEGTHRLNGAAPSRDPQQLAKWFGGGGHRHMALYIDLDDTYTTGEMHFTPGPFTDEYVSVLARHE